AVIAYNKWQENKERQNVEKAFSTPPDDVLMGSGADTPDDERKREPVFQHASAVAESEASPPFQPETQAVPDDTELPPVDEYVPHDLPIDDVIDCAIPMLPDSPLRGEKILNLIQGLRHIAGKPVHYLGERADGAWELVAQGGAYSTVVASVQLANRAGMLNELEYSELISRLRQIADELGAELEVP